MKKLNLLILIFATIISISSCTQESDKKSNDKTSDKIALNDFEEIDSFLPESTEGTQKFKISSVSVSNVCGLRGTTIKVKPEVLETIDGSKIEGDIELELIEMTSKLDFMKNNVQTVSNGKILVSGGAYYINMTAGGKQLKIKNNKFLEVEFPKITDDEMELFVGERDSSGNMNWIPAKEKFTSKPKSKEKKVVWMEEPEKPQVFPAPAKPNKIETTVIKVQNDSFFVNEKFQDAREVANKDEVYKKLKAQYDKWYADNKTYIETYDAIKISNLGWINCDRFLKDPNPPIQVVLNIKDEEIQNARVYAIFEDINSMMQSNYAKKGDKISFNGIPRGKKIRIIALSAKKDKPQLFNKVIDTSTENNLEIKFEETNIQEINSISLNEVKNINKVYPNPTSDYCNVELKNTGNYILELLNNSGSILSRAKLNELTTKVDLKSYASGIYYIRLYNESNSKFETEKIIKN